MWSSVACLLLAGFLGLASCGDLTNDAVAQVGQVFITKEQFDTLAESLEAAGRGPSKDSSQVERDRFKKGVVEYLVIQEICSQKAPFLAVTVGEQDIQIEVDKLRAMFGTEERFAEALSRQNITLEAMIRSVGDTLLLERVKSSVTANIEVGDEEALAYYEAHKNEFTIPEKRQASHILISSLPHGASGEPSQKDWELARTEAEKMRVEILNGASFASVAAKYSDDEETKNNGGMLGLITKGEMIPAFETSVFSLQKGQVSQPVQTPYGYHLIEVNDIIPGEQLPFEKVIEQIKNSIFIQKRTLAWDAWLSEQKGDLGVEYRGNLRPIVNEEE